MQCRRPGIDPWVRKIPWRREWLSTPVYSCLENSMDRGSWWATVHGVTKSQTQLSDFHFTATLLLGFPGGANGKEPAYQCGRHKRLGFDPWRTGQQHIPVFLPGESHVLKRLSTHTQNSLLTAKLVGCKLGSFEGHSPPFG